MKNEVLRVGVFDSGLGGLTVVQAISKVIKGAELFYIADTKNAPYGEKTPEQILQFSLNITKYFIKTYKINILVLACNTATSFAISKLRELYPSLVIIGTEPGLKPAIAQSKTGNIGILATPATLKSDKYQKLVRELSHEKDVQFFEQACPGLVEQIEKGEISTFKTKNLLSSWLVAMKMGHVDTIVLGCTHYPLVAKEIREIMSCDVLLIETGIAIAKRLMDLALQESHVNQGDLEIHILTTGKMKTYAVKEILNFDVDIKSINMH